MKITMTGRNTEITEALRERFEKKLGKLNKFLREETAVLLRLTQERANRNTVEVTIPFDGIMLRAEETGADPGACIDKVVDVLQRQIRRHRTKLDKRLRVGVVEADFDIEPEDEDAELVRTKHFTMKPMSVEDAITQMDLLGHSFFLFLNATTEAACVVYKRQDGNYGLLEPDNT